MRIAVLDDEPEQLQLISAALTNMTDWTENHACVLFDKGEDLLHSIKKGETYDLLLLDWMLPDLDGAAVLQWVRMYHPVWLPVIMLSSRAAVNDVVQLLNAGADDYIVKPFRKQELVARVMSAMRRNRDVRRSTLAQRHRFGGTEFDEGSQTARLRTGKVVSLTEKEMRLALLLFRNAGLPLSRDYVLEAVWATPTDHSRKLDTHLSHLRRKLDLSTQDEWHLVSVYGHGYRLEATGVPLPDSAELTSAAH